MIKFYSRQEDGRGETGSSMAELLSTQSARYSFIWVDIEGGDRDELARVAQEFNLDGDCIEDCLEGEQRPRIDKYDGYAFIMLYGALGPHSDTEFSPRKLAIFISARYIITVHTEPLISINKWRDRLMKKSNGAKDFGTDHFFYLIVDSMVDNYIVVSEAYDERLDALEERSLLHTPEPDVLAGALQLRRQMLDLRRLASSLREALHPLVTGDLDFISDKISIEFIHVRDHLTHTIEMVDNLRELLNGVRDNYHASLSLHANAIMQTLTIFASLFLPLSLIAGIYGMNTPLWPSVESPNSFWVIIGAMGVLIITMLGFYKRNKWF